MKPKGLDKGASGKTAQGVSILWSSGNSDLCVD